MKQKKILQTVICFFVFCFCFETSLIKAEEDYDEEERELAALHNTATIVKALENFEILTSAVLQKNSGCQRFISKYGRYLEICPACLTQLSTTEDNQTKGFTICCDETNSESCAYRIKITTPQTQESYNIEVFSILLEIDNEGNFQMNPDSSELRDLLADLLGYLADVI